MYFGVSMTNKKKPEPVSDRQYANYFLVVMRNAQT